MLEATMRLFPWFILSLFACQRSEHNTCTELPPIAAWDSIADARILNVTRFSPDSIFEFKHLSQFDTVIAINLHEGWGSFDYYAMLYTQFGAVQSELFQFVDEDLLTLNDSFFNLPSQGYGKAMYGSIRKKASTSEMLLHLLNLLDSCDFWCTHRNANQCYTSIDGLSWNLTVKVGDKFHRVFWANCYIEKPDSGCVNKCREMEIIARRVFYASGLPRNKYVIISREDGVGSDSTKYAVYTRGPFFNTQIYCRGKPIPDSGWYIVSNKDKDWYKYLEVAELYPDGMIRYIPKIIRRD